MYTVIAYVSARTCMRIHVCLWLVYAIDLPVIYVSYSFELLKLLVLSLSLFVAVVVAIVKIMTMMMMMTMVRLW